MIIGIDLGTTHSLAAVSRNGQTELIPNSLGHVLTPSAVSLDDRGDLLVGLAARERWTAGSNEAAVAFKRWMGTDKVTVLGKRGFLPEELSAAVLRALKADAEAYLGEPVTEAVITVPAYFNQRQRQATKAAGQIAGLNVERLLNEPTAAGLAYGLQERVDQQTFLVFDLGGGTFDVSVLEYFDGVIEVRASSGDTRLGGEDFTRVLAKLFLESCSDLSFSEKNRLLSSGAVWRQAEQAKRTLSDATEAHMQFVHNGRMFEHTIRRDTYEEATKELVQRLRRPIERALLDARLLPDEISEIILVGGASRMPVVRQAVARLFHRLPLRSINPDEIIARGAAVQAALKAKDAAFEEIVLTDVMPYSLGIIISESVNGRLFGNQFSPIIERNTPVPVSRVKSYCTVQNKQRVLSLDIRQGESPIGTDNISLGKLEIEVPPMQAGEATIDVRFSYDANGLLVVDARDIQGGRTVNTVIKHHASTLGPDEIEAALKALDALKIHPRDKQENTYLIERAKRLYEEQLGENREILQHALNQFMLVLDTQDERLIEKSRQDFATMLNSLDRGFIL